MSQPTKGLPRWLGGKESACQCRRGELHPWVVKIPWRRKWQPTPVFLPGKSHGQRSLAGYSLCGCKESDRTERANTHVTLNRHLQDNWFWEPSLEVTWVENEQFHEAILGAAQDFLTHVVVPSCSSEIKANTLSWGVLLPLLFRSADTSISHVLSSDEATLAVASDFDRISSL